VSVARAMLPKTINSIMEKHQNTELWQFHMRSGGSSRALYRLKQFDDLPLAERLLCALARRDRQLALSVLSLPLELWLNAFLGLVQENGLAALVSYLLCDLALMDVLRSMMLVRDDGLAQKDGVWYESGLAVNLQRMSAVELSRYDELDAQFISLVKTLEPIRKDVVWPKGIALSRTLYVEPFHRASGDLDCIVRTESAEQFVSLCQNAGYSPILGDAGFCNQLCVGPTESIKQLFLAPAPILVPSAVIGFACDNSSGPTIDPKFNPLDRGLAASKSSWGRIVNISTSGAYCFPEEVSYGAAKLAVESYSRSAATELGRFGITVNIISPGATQTGWIDADFERKISAQTPLRRVGQPDDIADVVVFLCSKQARWVTGQLIHVGGGSTV